MMFPPSKQKAYKEVFTLACRNLLASDMESRFQFAGLAYRHDGEQWLAEVPFFDDLLTLEVPGFSIRSAKNANVTLVSRIIVLHYMLTASGFSLKPLSERIAYEDIPGCRHYQPVFEKRVVKPLLMAFSQERDAFLQAGLGLGGSEEELGDASFTVYALPRIPITFVLWEGDSEFQPSLRLLFDPSINRYLPLEDIVVLSKLASTRILKSARRALADGYDE
jgi:hypothetical protein